MIRQSPRVVIAQFLSACAIVLALVGCDNGSRATTPPPNGTFGPPTCSSHSTMPVTLNMYYGSEKQNWLDPIIKTFNDRHYVACDGPIHVTATPIGSGLSETETLAGQIQPDVWSPAGSAWLALMNAGWQQKYGTTFASSDPSLAPSLLKSPVVICMWRDEAQALGWPQKAIGWSDIAALSADPHGWATYGHPEWGTFKFGHTRPDLSNSGLDTIIGEVYAATAKQRDLTHADVASMATQEFIANAESAVTHYGESTGFFATEMFNGGPSFLSAAAMYESLVVEGNTPGLYPKVGAQFPSVVAIYPKEGTFYSDHPFVIAQASWMTPAKTAAAEVLRNYLLDKAQQQSALQFGFRPGINTVPVSAPIDTPHGVDPSQPTTLLQIPQATVISEILSVWSELRRKVDVMLILDRSGSMNDVNGTITKIDGAKAGLKEFVSLLGDDDGLGLTVFSDAARVLTPVTPLGPKRAQMGQLIDGITAQGSTKLYDTIADQQAQLLAQPSTHIKALVVLTDGMDTASALDLPTLLPQISLTGANAGDGVRIFTIAYGTDADTNALMSVANAGGGAEYAGTTDNIITVYDTISQFF